MCLLFKQLNAKQETLAAYYVALISIALLLFLLIIEYLVLSLESFFQAGRLDILYLLLKRPKSKTRNTRDTLSSKCSGDIV